MHKQMFFYDFKIEVYLFSLIFKIVQLDGIEKSQIER